MKRSKLLPSGPVSIPFGARVQTTFYFITLAGWPGVLQVTIPQSALQMFQLGHALGRGWCMGACVMTVSVACCGDHGEAMPPKSLVLSSGWFKLRVLKAPACSHKVPTREGCIICLALVIPLCPSCRQCLRSVWGVGSSQEALSLEVQVCCPKPSSHSTKAWHEAASLFAHISQTVKGISLWAASPRLISSQKSRGAEFVEFVGTTSLRFRASPKKIW